MRGHERRLAAEVLLGEHADAVVSHNSCALAINVCGGGTQVECGVPLTEMSGSPPGAITAPSQQPRR